jgi:hypothetical protein
VITYHDGGPTLVTAVPDVTVPETFSVLSYEKNDKNILVIYSAA